MFPDLDRVRRNETLEGRVFGVLVESAGPGVQRRSMSIKESEWDRCVACSRYRECYDLSLAKLCLHHALQTC
jgi:hypothetical protein